MGKGLAHKTGGQSTFYHLDREGKIVRGLRGFVVKRKLPGVRQLPLRVAMATGLADPANILSVPSYSDRRKFKMSCFCCSVKEWYRCTTAFASEPWLKCWRMASE
jgi:hypothetical protein